MAKSILLATIGFLSFIFSNVGCATDSASPSFSISNSVSSGTLGVGQTETLQTTVTTTQNFYIYSIQIAITDPSGAVETSQTFWATPTSTGASVQESLSWTVPSNAAAGTYTMTTTASSYYPQLSSNLSTTFAVSSASSPVGSMGSGSSGASGSGSGSVPLSGAAVNIMPLGDSITNGLPDWQYGGYRHLLWNLLTQTDGLNVNLVGPLSNGDFPSPNNAGFSGWTAATLQGIFDQAGYFTQYKPDIVLLLIGTNALATETATQNVADISALIDDALTTLPNSRVIVATLTPRLGTWNANIQQVNALIPAMVASKGSRVTMVDMYSALTTADLADGLHPLDEGYDKMAHVWEPAVKALLQP